MKRLSALVCAVVLLASACSSDPGAEEAASPAPEASTTTTLAATSTTAAPTTTTTPPTTTEAPVDLEGIASEITLAAEAWMSDRDLAVPGLSVAVRYPDGNTIELAFGMSDLRTETELTTDDYFRIGSITKTITAATLLLMVEDGLLGLDDPVSDHLGDWLPGYVIDGVDYGGQVTVRQILGHTDGFKEFAWDIPFYDATSRRLDQVFDPREIVEWGLEQGPQFVPGEDYSYNTVGTVAAGLLIESVSGNPAEQEIRTRLLDPLGLEHLFLPPGDVPPAPVVHGYAVGPLHDILNTLPALESLREAATVGDYFDIMAAPQEALESVGWTGGGAVAQAGDLATLFAALFDGTLLSDESITSMTTPNPYSDYGLSLDINEWRGQAYLNKGGGVPGFRSLAGYLPESGISVVLLANSIFLDPDVGILMEQVLGLVTDS